MTSTMMPPEEMEDPNEFVDIDVNDTPKSDPKTDDPETASESAKDSAPDSQEPRVPCSDRWTRTVEWIRAPLLKFVYALSHNAATHPKIYVIGALVLAIATIATGLSTNFEVDIDEETLWTPKGSKPIVHGKWIEDDSGFPAFPRTFNILIHNNGNGNVLGMIGVSRVFTALDTVRTTPGYDELCALAGSFGVMDENGEITCAISSVTEFWKSDASLFVSSVFTNEEAIKAMSNTTYPDGEPVDRASIIGQAEEGDDGILTSGASYMLQISLPADESVSEPFEKEALDRILYLQDVWATEAGNDFRVEVFSERSFADEFSRAIEEDTPLIPAVFFVMSVFCCMYFARCNAVRSQSLMGFGAVISVLLSIMTGYGLLFICGVPFTSLTQILPFIMFGIGLDDAFIIAGSYSRTDLQKDPVDRIQDTMEDVGGSIMLTTITSTVAFALGASSSIPAVYYLCLYAFPTVMFDFLFQITFFVALIVIDERRKQDNRRDCLVCFKAKHMEGMAEEDGDVPNKKGHFVDRMMAVYVEILLKPVTKVAVLVLFSSLLAVSAWRVSELEQYFDFTDVIPSDSYITSFVDSVDLHSDKRYYDPRIYFRDVDFSDPDIQRQMQDYVDQIVHLEQVSDPPMFFWLKDFNSWKLQQNTSAVQNLSFEEQMDEFLMVPLYEKLYGDHIVRNEEGVMTSSRTKVFMDKVDDKDVRKIVEALFDQRDVTKAQPINQGLSDWKFFTQSTEYYIWEFYSVAVEELILTTVLGVVAVSAIAMFLIPHWTAALYVGPAVCVLYIDLLGFIQMFGLDINSVTYVSMVMSIGLMVDYVMHIVIKYYESKELKREDKVRDTVVTMGSSILVGGCTTLLGVIPLAFSTSEIFHSVFVTFIGLVILGCAHGLIAIPVILSLIGPLDGVASRITHPTAPKRGSSSSAAVKVPQTGKTEHTEESSEEN